MRFTDPTDVHMTADQADHFANGQSARMIPDYSTTDAWLIEADNGTDQPTTPFRFKSKSDALVGMARIARLRPEIPLVIIARKEPRHG